MTFLRFYGRSLPLHLQRLYRDTGNICVLQRLYLWSQLRATIHTLIISRAAGSFMGAEPAVTDRATYVWLPPTEFFSKQGILLTKIGRLSVGAPGRMLQQPVNTFVLRY